jgi:hypothetical protein
MMGIVMPETCWAVSVRQSNKILWLIVASSWVFYLSDWRCTEPQTLNVKYVIIEDSHTAHFLKIRTHFLSYYTHLFARLRGQSLKVGTSQQSCKDLPTSMPHSKQFTLKWTAANCRRVLDSKVTHSLYWKWMKWVNIKISDKNKF